jgi:hypothetical protein
MRSLTSVMGWLFFGTWLVAAVAQPAEEAQKAPQGAWVATRADCEGKAAADVVGNWLAFTSGSGYVLITFKRAKP